MRLAILLLCLGLCAACGASAPSATEAKYLERATMVDDTLKADLETLRGAKVFFGHQSVGVNILDGLATLSREAGIPVQIGEAGVGANQHPLSKFDDFARHAESVPPGSLQLMLVKLCFADFEPNTDVAPMIEAYRSAVERVRKAQPGVRIVHITPPLFATPSGLKTRIKRMLGKALWEEQANAKSAAFREQLLAAFPGEPTFDLAALESLRPDGTREQCEVDGKKVAMLWPGFASDSGHLNEIGKRVVAKAFAHALAEALR
jgi:hypothetical protein